MANRKCMRLKCEGTDAALLLVDSSSLALTAEVAVAT
jgi:hypothetical protein